MLCPTTMRFLPLAGLALVVIVAVVLLATRRLILGLIIGLAVLALGGLLALPAFWCTSRSVAVRTAASKSALPAVPAPCQASIVTGSDECVVALSIPEVVLLAEDAAGSSAGLLVETDDLRLEVAYAEPVRVLGRSLQELARSKRADPKDLRRRLARLSEYEGSEVASELLTRVWADLVENTHTAAPVSTTLGEVRMREARFGLDDIRRALASWEKRRARNAARPRSVVLSVVVVSGLLIVAYSLLQAGLRRAATARPPAPRPHG